MDPFSSDCNSFSQEFDEKNKQFPAEKSRKRVLFAQTDCADWLLAKKLSPSLWIIQNASVWFCLIFSQIYFHFLWTYSRSFWLSKQLFLAFYPPSHMACFPKRPARSSELLPRMKSCRICWTFPFNIIKTQILLHK